MSVEQFWVEVSIPWLPKSKMKIRPLTLKDERKMLANPNESKAYEELIDDCVQIIEGFDKQKELSAVEVAWLLCQIRLITYGEDAVYSGIKCPSCGHVNNNHMIDLTKIKLHENKDYLYIVPKKSKFKDNDGNVVEKVRIAYPSVSRMNAINESVKGKSEEESNADIYYKLLLAVFIDYTDEELDAMVESGDLNILDAKYANQMLAAKPYGFDYSDKMKCHKCKGEFDYEIPVIGDGFLVPYFADIPGSED